MSTSAQDAASAKMAELCQRALSVVARCQQPYEEAFDDGISNVPICTFFLSAGGCMRGDACWYQHVTTPASVDDTAVLADAQAVVETVSAKLSAIEASESTLCFARQQRAAEALCWRGPDADPDAGEVGLAGSAGEADAEFVAISSGSEDGDAPPRWQPPSSDDDDASKSTSDSSHMRDEDEIIIIGEKLDPSRRRKMLPCQQVYVVPTKRARTGRRNALEASNLSQRWNSSSSDQRRREGKLRSWAD
jgi:hypothetical protein